MKTKFISLLLCVLCATLLFTACKKDKEDTIVDLPITEANPDITSPEGKFFESSGKLRAEGGLSALGDGFIRIMVEGEEYEFNMSDEVIRKIGIFNKDENNLQIKRGTILMLTYEIKDGTYFATDIEIITSN